MKIDLDIDSEIADVRKERESVEDEYFKFKKHIHQTEEKISEIEKQLFRLDEIEDEEVSAARAEFRSKLLRNFDALDESNARVKKKINSKMEELDDEILELQIKKESKNKSIE